MSLVKVVKEYSFIISLHHVYGSDVYGGGFVTRHPDDRPEVSN